MTSSGYYLDRCWDNWYVLRGGTNWASVEGEAEEWLEIACGIIAGKNVHHRRCAAYRDDAGYTFSSPRNSTSERDSVWMDHDEAKVLAKQIVDTLRADGHECVIAFDPIELGA